MGYDFVIANAGAGDSCNARPSAGELRRLRRWLSLHRCRSARPCRVHLRPGRETWRRRRFPRDFDLTPDKSILPKIARQMQARGYAGGVSVGHATKASAMMCAEVAKLDAMLTEAGVSVTALPATDLFLNGRDAERLVAAQMPPHAVETIDS